MSKVSMIAPLGCSVMEVQRLKKNLEKIWKTSWGKVGQNHGSGQVILTF